MEILLTYGSGRKPEALDVAPGQTPREALRAAFGHENNFLILGGTLPPDMDIATPLPEPVAPPIVEEPTPKKVTRKAVKGE